MLRAHRLFKSTAALIGTDVPDLCCVPLPALAPDSQAAAAAQQRTLSFADDLETVYADVFVDALNKLLTCHDPLPGKLLAHALGFGTKP